MILKKHRKEFELKLDIDGLWVWKDYVSYPVLERMSLIQEHPFWEYSPVELLRLGSIIPVDNDNSIRIQRLFSYGSYYDR